MIRRARKALVAAICVLVVGAGNAFAGTYAENLTLQPGQSGGSSGWNVRTYNWIAFDNPWGGLPQMGSAYWRSDLTTNGYVWSDTGNLYDDRDMAYGFADCRANSGNGYNVDLWWCETN